VAGEREGSDTHVRLISLYIGVLLVVLRFPELYGTPLVGYHP